MKAKSELHSVDSFHYKMCPPPLSPLSLSPSSTPPPPLPHPRPSLSLSLICSGADAEDQLLHMWTRISWCFQPNSTTFMAFPLPLCKCYVYITIVSLHRNVCISGTSSGTYRVFAYSVVLFLYFRMVSVLCSSGGEQKCTKKNRTPILLGMIEPPILNGFSRPSGKRLQLHSWDMDGTYIGL